MQQVPCVLMMDIMVYLDSKEIFKNMITVDKNIKSIIESENFLEKHFKYNGNEEWNKYYGWCANIRVLENIENIEKDEYGNESKEIIVNNNREKLKIIRKLYKTFNGKVYEYFKKSQIIKIFLDRKYDVEKSKYIISIDKRFEYVDKNIILHPDVERMINVEKDFNAEQFFRLLSLHSIFIENYNNISFIIFVSILCYILYCNLLIMYNYLSIIIFIILLIPVTSITLLFLTIIFITIYFNLRNKLAILHNIIVYGYLDCNVL